MHPLLKSGDQVRVLPVANFSPGDVVVFNHPLHGLTAHRLLGMTLSSRGLRYMTKADNAKVIDRLLEPDEILGRSDMNLSQGRNIRPGLSTRLACTTQMLTILFKRVLINLFRPKK
ncbi:MAG: hypothetical protein ACI9I4_000881 [Neolewinella sp.]|jgi:hypothetical protein